MSSEVALRFVERINAHDPKGLVSLMTRDHTFTDSLGAVSRRPAIESGWNQYFEMVPDYWIRIDRVISEGNTVVLVGVAGGSYVPRGRRRRPRDKWETPAVWIGRIVHQKVAEWRIYADNEPIRARMREWGAQSRT